MVGVYHSLYTPDSVPQGNLRAIFGLRGKLLGQCANSGPFPCPSEYSHLIGGSAQLIKLLRGDDRGDNDEPIAIEMV